MRFTPRLFVILLALLLAPGPRDAFADKPPDPPPPPPPPPSAPQNYELRLSWDRCAGDGRIVDRTFACDTNTGIETFVGSVVFRDGVGRDSVLGFAAYVDISPAASLVPSWWTTRSAECRPYALLPDWSGLAGASQCLPWFGDGTPLGVSGILSSYDRLVLQIAWLLPSGQQADLLPAREYSLFRVRLSHAKSTGTGACSGCTVPTCIGFGRLDLDYVPPGPREVIAGVGLNTLTWQGGYVADYPTQAWPQPPQYSYVNVLSCTTAPVPTRGRTWGLIKTLYR